ncbi:hypothetical protein [Brevibacillus agri]|uniref:hypothetical protein n=1 Tax=Brevibacillus agri TaxID=51101 RepID=UPI0004710453|nr:hypothetical protein [Brevibacillus agri]
MYYLLIPLFGVPLILAIFALRSRRSGFWKKWWPPVVSALLIYGGCLAANVYWQVQYGIPVLPTKADLELFLYFCLFLVFVFFIMYLVFFFVMRKPFWKMNLLFLATSSGLFLLFAGAFLGMGPFMSKVEYVSVVQSVKNKWQAVSVQASSNKPIDVTLVYSKRDCLKRCAGQPYDSLILVRNQSGQPLGIELLVRLQNESGAVIEDKQALPLKLAAGEIAPVWTEDTNMEENFWERVSTVTDERVAAIAYQFSIIDRR